MIRALSTAMIVAIGATTLAYAQSGAIGQRQEAMKAMASATKAPGAILKGETPFDLAKTQASLVVYQEQAAKLKNLWPDDSKSGDTYALPAIWEKKSEFLARFDKLAADSKAAAAIKDEASFKAEYPKVLQNCSGCHTVFRKPD